MTATENTAPTLHEKILTNLDRAVDAVGTFFTDPANPESPDPRKISAGMLVLKRAFEMHDAITAKQEAQFGDDEACDKLFPDEEIEAALERHGYTRIRKSDNFNDTHNDGDNASHNGNENNLSDAHAAHGPSSHLGDIHEEIQPGFRSASDRPETLREIDRPSPHHSPYAPDSSPPGQSANPTGSPAGSDATSTPQTVP